jgi:hypothetical protein
MLTSTSAFAENADFIQLETPLKYELNLGNDEITQAYDCNIPLHSSGQVLILLNNWMKVVHKTLHYVKDLKI